MMILGSVISIIAGNGWWLIGGDLTSNIGGIKSEKRGHLAIPTSGWEYYDSEWHKDDTLKFTYM